MNVSLQGKSALVTGASSGIGAAIALSLARAGARVSAVARRSDRLEDLAALARGEALQLETVCADITAPGQAALIVEQVRMEAGRVDILVNNAGVMFLGPLADADLYAWSHMLELNLMCAMAMSQAAFREMRARRSGDIVNISSVSGRVAGAISAGYSASKFGLNGFSEALRREALKDNVRVTVIEPGAVATELRDHIADPVVRGAVNTWAQNMRQLRPEDVADAVLYAVSRPDHVSINEILIRPTDQDT